MLLKDIKGKQQPQSKYLDRIVSLLADSAHETIDSNLDSLPTLIAIHGIVATGDGGQLSVLDIFHLLQQLLQVSGSRARGSVASIAEKVNVNLRHLGLLGSIQESKEVGYVTVDTSVRDLWKCQRLGTDREGGKIIRCRPFRPYQAHEVETAIAGLGMLERGLDVLQLSKLLLGCGKIDTDNVLDNPAPNKHERVLAAIDRNEYRWGRYAMSGRVPPLSVCSLAPLRENDLISRRTDGEEANKAIAPFRLLRENPSSFCCSYLVDNTTSTNVQVSDLRVAHKAIGKTDVETVSTEGGERVLLLELVHVGSVGVADGITAGVCLGGDSPAVDDDADDVVLDRCSVGHGSDEKWGWRERMEGWRE